MLRGDPGRLRQILLNLLGNAVKFTSAGEVRLAARVIADHGDRVQLGITVRDTGMGIPEHLHDRLFTPYAQADPSVPRLYGGSGLGLSICRRLVTLMGGTVAFSSAPDVGTTFELDLVLAKALQVRLASGIGRDRHCGHPPAARGSEHHDRTADAAAYRELGRARAGPSPLVARLWPCCGKLFDTAERCTSP